MAFEADGAVLLQSKRGRRIVAAFGDPAPGGGTFVRALAPSLNAKGQIAFIAEAAPPSRSGIFLLTGEAITQIVGFGDPVPGGEFAFAFEVSLNANGQAAFHAMTFGEEGIYFFSKGTITLLARQGEPAPGGGTFDTFRPPAINASGQVVFLSFLDLGSGIFLASDGTLQAVARDGDPAPSGDSFDFPLAHGEADRRGRSRDLALGSATFRSFPYGSATTINDAGQVAFAATASIRDRGGIFLFSDGRITREIAVTDPAPEGGTFGYVDSPSLNAAGQIAFLGGATGAYLFSRGSFTQVVVPMQPSPEGDVFTAAAAPSLNLAGQVMFTGRLENHLAGIYLFSTGTITRVAGQGDSVERQPGFISASPQANSAEGRLVLVASSFPGGDGLFDGALTPIVRSGDPAPEGGMLTSASQPALNKRGQVAFIATSSRRGRGLYLSSDGKLTRVASIGDPAPGGGRFIQLSSPSINGVGDVAFVGWDGSFDRSALYLSSSGLRVLVATGDSAPGGGTFRGFALTSLNDAGQLAFFASVTAAGRSGFFVWSQGSVQPIAQTGDPAPGGGTFNFPDSLSLAHRPSINRSGSVAFAAPMSIRRGLFLFSSGMLSSIARPGDPVPGGGTFLSADLPSLNDAGQIAFRGLATIGFFGVYLYSDGTIAKIARQDDPAPGGDTLDFADSPKMDAHGRVAFAGGVSGSVGTFLATPSR